MKKILITGVNGFIGHSAAVYFGKEYEVYGMDISTEYRGDGGKITYYQCNMSGSPAELFHDRIGHSAGCDLTLRGQCECRRIGGKSDGGS